MQYYNHESKGGPPTQVHIWGCEAVRAPSWPGGAGGEEEQGCCEEAGALEEEHKPKQHFGLI